VGTIPIVGINHIALEVRDVEEALEFWGRIFEFELRARSAHGLHRHGVRRNAFPERPRP
jgi:catechol 2,3-dioxygenase-like lactoylglutathione lyase family enzyme